MLVEDETDRSVIHRIIRPSVQNRTRHWHLLRTAISAVSSEGFLLCGTRRPCRRNDDRC